GGLLFNGDAPSDPGRQDPGKGTWYGLTGGIRLRPLDQRKDPSRGTGLWIDVGGGAGYTGHKVLAALEAGLVWGFAVGRADIGPSIRYLQIFETKNKLDDSDAHLGLVGLEVTFFDRREGPKAPIVHDRDGDGIIDSKDKCPDQPEDRDGFEDADG